MPSDPTEPITLAEWAERYRVLSRSTSGEPGPWRADRTPYLDAMMRDIDWDAEPTVVTFQFSGSVGTTESGPTCRFFQVKY